MVGLRCEGIGASLSSTRHAHRPSAFLERARVRYPAFSSSRSIRRTRSRPIRSPGPARCCNKYGSATSRICQPSGFAISQFATARVSNCSRASSINARGIGTQPRLRCLIRSTASSGVVSVSRCPEGGTTQFRSGRFATALCHRHVERVAPSSGAFQNRFRAGVC